MLGFGNRKQNIEQEYPESARVGYPGQPQAYSAQQAPGAPMSAAPSQGPSPVMLNGTAPMQFGMQPQDMRGGAGVPQLEAYIAKRTAEIDAQAAEFSKKNPDFDIRRELRNPKFCGYLWGNGLSVEDAYYLTHRGDEGTENRAAAEGPEKRITENGTSKPGGSGMVKKNPEDMSDEEVDDIIRRVRRGEKISF